MLTREQKRWLLIGYCTNTGDTVGCLMCKMRHICDATKANYADFDTEKLDACIKIIAPNVLEEPKPENPEPTGQRFSFHYYPIVVKSDASKFTNALNKTSRKGFIPVSSGVLRQKNGMPCVWAIMSRPETPEEAKEDLE